MGSFHTSRREFLNLLAAGAAALAWPGGALGGGRRQEGPGRRVPVPFTAVRFTDGFWLPRLETNRRVTIPYTFGKCEETGRIANFAKAGGLLEGTFQGLRYDDSDVFKVIEGAAYALALQPDPALDRYLDDVVAKIAAAQEDDGYLYTVRTLRPNDPPEGVGATRWSYLAHSHELYNVGHLYEAAVAHHQATGKRTLLEVALRNADLVASVFGPQKRRDVPGHEEIEIGLVKLYRTTGDRRYLDLARFFLDERGRANGRELYGRYAQDHLPVVEQREAVGHAVRAGYLYAGMADVAQHAGAEAYVRALDAIWEDVVSGKLYITGGIGSSRRGEAFGDDYDLPNASAYNETCAAVANALWNHRMFLLHGEARYLDVLERVLYNGFLVGVSLEGNRFFYPNPLESDGKDPFNHGAPVRQEWFRTSCCPVNVVRFLPSIAGYVYAAEGDAVYVNLYAGGRGTVPLGEHTVGIMQETRYPWDGRVTIRVEPGRAETFALYLRIPGWATGQPVPSDLYRFAQAEAEPFTLAVNGRPVRPEMERGFAVVRRRWKAGDEVVLILPMPVRRVLAHPNVKADEGRVAVQRGPIVYCAEGVDHGGRALNLVLPDEARLVPEHRPDLLGGVTVLRGPGQAVFEGEGGARRVQPAALTLIPYYAWAHRGAAEMAAWLPRRPDLTRA